MKRPEVAVNMFIRFILAKASIDYGLELMMALFSIVQGIVSKIMATSGLASVGKTVLPDSIITAIEDSGFWESVPLWPGIRKTNEVSKAPQDRHFKTSLFFQIIIILIINILK